jgi:transposase
MPRDDRGGPLLSHSQRQMVLQALRVGAPLKHASIAAGIPEGTFKSWLSRGREERARRAAGAPNRTYDRHVELLEDVEKADAEGAVANVVAIQRAASGGRWQAAAWLLSRRHPEEWGPPEQRVRITSVDEDESPRDSLMSELSRMSDRMSFKEHDPTLEV